MKEKFLLVSKSGYCVENDHVDNLTKHHLTLQSYVLRSSLQIDHTVPGNSLVKSSGGVRSVMVVTGMNELGYGPVYCSDGYDAQGRLCFRDSIYCSQLMWPATLVSCESSQIGYSIFINVLHLFLLQLRIQTAEKSVRWWCGIWSAAATRYARQEARGAT